jgi:hypothetical protein
MVKPRDAAYWTTGSWIRAIVKVTLSETGVDLEGTKDLENAKTGSRSLISRKVSSLTFVKDPLAAKVRLTVGPAPD